MMPEEKQEQKFLKFKNKNVVPPGGYYFIDPVDEFRTDSASMSRLARDVSRHRVANGVDVPFNLPEIIEDQICRRIPITMTNANAETKKRTRGPLTMTAVRAATTIALHAHRNAGRKVCSVAESEERAKLCADCEKNVPSVACMSCRGLKDWVRGWIPRETTFDKALTVCDITATMNMSCVHMLKPALQSCTPVSTIRLHPDWCWKRILLDSKLRSENAKTKEN